MAETLEEMMEEFWEKWQHGYLGKITGKADLPEYVDLCEGEMLQDLHALCDKAVREHEGKTQRDPTTKPWPQSYDNVPIGRICPRCGHEICICDR